MMKAKRFFILGLSCKIQIMIPLRAHIVAQAIKKYTHRFIHLTIHGFSHHTGLLLPSACAFNPRVLDAKSLNLKIGQNFQIEHHCFFKTRAFL